ncbi:MAG: quinoprotein dehydrogenase-associated putative ABC transporter substrate-binding protein [Gammaproteobacteria bacterium]|jgi:mxaJ protein
MTNKTMTLPSYLFLMLLVLVPLAMMAQSAVASEQPLRVCADPDYMPYSNRAGQGFENHVAELVAKAMGRKLEYHWASLRGQGGFSNFLALNLDAGHCDVVMGIPYGDPEELYTKPYYESSYVFVFKKDKHYDITSMDSPVLRHLKIGYEEDTPPQTGLKLRGLLFKAKQFHVADNKNLSPKSMLQAVRDGKVDVIITWEPAIGYYLHDYPDLKVVRVPNTRSTGSPERYLFSIAMGVRAKDHSLKNELDSVINSHKSQIKRVLDSFNVKLYPTASGESSFADGTM